MSFHPELKIIRYFAKIKSNSVNKVDRRANFEWFWEKEKTMKNKKNTDIINL